MADTLLVTYSRTGTAKNLAQKLAELCCADADYLTYEGGKSVSFLGACVQALRKSTKPFEGDRRDPAAYDRIIFVSPVWAGTIATPIRAYMSKHSAKLSAKDCFLLTVSKNTPPERAAIEFEQILGSAPSAMRNLTEAAINENTYDLTQLLSGE